MSTLTIDPAPVARVVLTALAERAMTLRALTAFLRSVGFEYEVAPVRVKEAIAELQRAGFVRRGVWRRGPVFQLALGAKRLRGGKWRVLRASVRSKGGE